jgi:hypothetical protein
VSSGVRELVLLVAAGRQVDEDAQIVLSRGDLDSRPRELCRELIEAPCCDAL